MMMVDDDGDGGGDAMLRICEALLVYTSLGNGLGVGL